MINNLKSELEFVTKDRDSYRSSYTLLLEEIRESEKKAFRMMEKFQELSISLKGKSTMIEMLQNNSTNDTKRIEDLNTQLKELNLKYLDVYRKWEAGALANNTLALQLDSYAINKQALEKNLEVAIAANSSQKADKVDQVSLRKNQEGFGRKSPKSKRGISTLDNSSFAAKNAPIDLRERCTILHDSLVKRVNDTLRFLILLKDFRRNHIRVTRIADMMNDALSHSNPKEVSDTLKRLFRDSLISHEQFTKLMDMIDELDMN